MVTSLFFLSLFYFCFNFCLLPFAVFVFSGEDLSLLPKINHCNLSVGNYLTAGDERLS